MRRLPGFVKTLLLLVVTAGAGSLLLTGCHDWGGGHRREGMDPARVEEHVQKGVDRLLKKVDATDEQRQKVYSLRDRIMPDIVDLTKDREATMNEIQEL